MKLTKHQARTSVELRGWVAGRISANAVRESSRIWLVHSLVHKGDAAALNGGTQRPVVGACCHILPMTGQSDQGQGMQAPHAVTSIMTSTLHHNMKSTSMQHEYAS